MCLPHGMHLRLRVVRVVRKEGVVGVERIVRVERVTHLLFER